MIFTSLAFIIFFAVVIIGTLIIQCYFNDRIKFYFLLVASYVFYGWWDWRFCFLLLFVTLTSYITALHSENKAAYTSGVSIPLIVLGIFKYFNFFLDSIAQLSGHEFNALKIILPVGISFYTFQALSYVIDVHRKKINAERDFVRLALYISFFPQLVAGPIVRASDFLPQLYEPERRLTAENFSVGIQLMAMGFFKKAVLADHLSVFVDDVFRVPIAFHWATIILAVFSYSLQIYFDFSGYSDIASGCAKCLGYDFSINFNLPYMSSNITEFWRRWHISLSGWLRDYVYIPLGGKRKGKIRQHINIMITMLLGGLWHGADWTFVFWGGLNGTALCFEKIFVPHERKHNLILRVSKIFYVFFFISFTWIFFRASSFYDAWLIINGIFTLQNGIVQPFFWSFFAFSLLTLSEFYAAFKSHRENLSCIHVFCPVMNLNSISGLTTFFVFIGIILGLAFTGEHPFIYFQF